MAARAKKKPSPRRKHPIHSASSSVVPPDYAGRVWCLRCGHMGRPGDVRHTEEFPETPAEDVSDRIIGEG